MDDGIDGDKTDYPEGGLTVIVEEDARPVALKPVQDEDGSRRKRGVMSMDELDDVDVDAEGESDEEKEDDIGWDDAYEQEV